MERLTRLIDRRRVIGALSAAAGGVCLIVGALLPWLTVFAGLRSYAGVAGINGRLLVAGGAVALLFAAWHLLSTRRITRYAIACLGFALSVFCAYLLAQDIALQRELGALYAAGLGPGLIIAALGAVLLLSTLAVPSTRGAAGARGSSRVDPVAVTLISLSAGAGTIHLAAAPAHLVEFTLYGVCFLIVGGAQILWAGLVAIRGLSRWLIAAAIGNFMVIGVWVLSRTTGLPIGPQPGVPEAAGYADVIASCLELVLGAAALAKLLLPSAGSRAPRPAAWTLPLAAATATVAGVLLFGAGSH